MSFHTWLQLAQRLGTGALHDLLSDRETERSCEALRSSERRSPSL